MGVRTSGAASQIVMEDWHELFTLILENSDIWTALKAGYVDDGREVTSTLHPGMRFSEEAKRFEFSLEGQEEDKKRAAEGESHNQRMARVLLPAMNSINKDLYRTSIGAVRI